MATDPVRDEAERLIAAALSTVSMAARGLQSARASRGGGFATGSPECCVCPLCRVIAAMREPGAEAAERLTHGAGDLAAGVASMLRALAKSGAEPRGTGQAGAEPRGTGQAGAEPRGTGQAGAEPRGTGQAGALRTWDWLLGPTTGADESEEDDPWHAATHTPPRAPMAKKAVVKKAVVKKAAPPAPAHHDEPDRVAAGPAEPAEARAPVAKKAATKKAVAKKAVAKKAPPGKAARPEPTAAPEETE